MQSSTRLSLLYRVLGGIFPMTSRVWFTIFHNRNTTYRACVKIDRAFHALTCILPFHGYFSRFCVIFLIRFGAVIAQSGRQFDENVSLYIYQRIYGYVNVSSENFQYVYNSSSHCLKSTANLCLYCV